MKALIKKTLNSFFKKFSLTVLPYDSHTIENHLRRRMELGYHKDFIFLQIGANDGHLCDPVFKIVNELGIKGVLVEPIKEYFDKLQENYKHNPNVKFINKAVFHHDGETVMYKVKEENEKDLPDWAKGIASLDKDHHRRSKTDAKYMEEVKVQCCTFSTLLKEAKIEGKLDLLLLDTEGFDYHIIKMIDFKAIQPKLIYFEHYHHSGVMDKNQVHDCLGILLENGYNFHFDKYDCLAYKITD
jgi:FkbM family methyltransferase